MTLTLAESTAPDTPASGMKRSPPSDCDQPRTPPCGAKNEACTVSSFARFLVWQPLLLHSMVPVALNTPWASSQYISYCLLPCAPLNMPVASNTNTLKRNLSAEASVRVFLVYLVRRPSAFTSVYGVFV